MVTFQRVFAAVLLSSCATSPRAAPPASGGEADLGVLIVQAEWPGASLVIDAIYRGKAQAGGWIVDLQFGEHTLAIHHEGRVVFERTLNFSPSASASTGNAREIKRRVLTKEEIRSSIEQNIQDIRACFESALATQPTLAGRVDTRFVIARDGSVAVANVVNSSVASLAVDECIAGALHRWTFPEPREAQTDDDGEGGQLTLHVVVDPAQDGGVRGGNVAVVVSYPFILENASIAEAQDHCLVTARSGAPLAPADAIGRVIQSQVAKLDWCLARERAWTPDLHGRIELLFGIAASGEVSFAGFPRSDFSAPHAEECILDEVRRWKFAPSGVAVTVTCPFLVGG